MKHKSLLLTLGIAVLSTATAIAQPAAKEVFELYNSTMQSYKQDYPAGIANMNKVLTMSAEVGEQCDEIKQKTEQMIPRAYYEYAMALYKNKDLQGTLDNLERAAEEATKYNNAEIKGRVEKTIPKLYNVMGTNMLKEEKYDEAIANFEKALQINPKLLDAQVNIMATYQKSGNDEKLLEAMTATKALAQSLNKFDVADDCNNRLKNFYLKRAEEARAAKNYKVAIEHYQKTVSYDSTDAQVYRSFSNACFSQENWTLTIEVATKAIELHQGTDIDKAAIYHELATAYQKTNNTAKACQMFEKAAFGEYKPNAEYQIKAMKCK